MNPIEIAANVEAALMRNLKSKRAKCTSEYYLLMFFYPRIDSCDNRVSFAVIYRSLLSTFVMIDKISYCSSVQRHAVLILFIACARLRSVVNNV